MGDSLWSCAEDFGRLLKQFHNVGPKVSLVFQGSTEAIERLYNPAKTPPSVVQNHPRTNGEFVCWLQLPHDWNGSQWSFGRVLCRDATPTKLNEFCRVAEQAGSFLRRNLRFGEWLMPCLEYITHAGRLPKLREAEDISWWLALLFMKPDVLKPQAKHGAAFVEIDDAVSLSQRAIHSWRLAANKPLWPVATQVIPPFAAGLVRSSQKRGRKPATDELIAEACEVRIEYQDQQLGQEAFCNWRNGKNQVGCAMVGPAWLKRRLALVAKLIREKSERIPQKYTNKFKPLRRVKSVPKKR